MSEHIYLDHNATTPVEPAVIEAMLPYFGEKFGNASSVHGFGRDAKVALETAREQIAAFINCQPSELIFTSGGTESDNMAIVGTAMQLKNRRNHLVVGAAEHHAVLEPAEFLHEKEGFDLTLLPVSAEGFHSTADLKAAISDKTAIVSLMHANNENGALQDIQSLAEVAHGVGALFHTDAVQSVGKIPVDVQNLGVDMLSLTGHKIYGPKGTGALFVRAGVKIHPLMRGGSHERKRRPGTENVAGAVGLAKALDIAGGRMQSDFNHLLGLSEYLIEKIRLMPDVHVNSPNHNRLPQTVNVSFVGLEGEPIIMGLDMAGIAVSSGSACTSGATQASHVLVAMSIPDRIAHGAIRFSLGRETTKSQLDRVLSELPPIIDRLRELAPAMPKV